MNIKSTFKYLSSAFSKLITGDFKVVFVVAGYLLLIVVVTVGDLLLIVGLSTILSAEPVSDHIKTIRTHNYKEDTYAYPQVKLILSRVYKYDTSPYSYFYSDCKLSQPLRCELRIPGIMVDTKYSTEHIVPASRMITHVGCSTRDRRKCSKQSPKLNKCLSNPYNLVPAVMHVNRIRYNKSFTDVVEPDAKKLTSAGFYVNKKTIVPPVKARAKIASAYIHMDSIDCIKMNDAERELMIEWQDMYRLRGRDKELIIAYFTIFPSYERAKYK